jgi:hypothetical protein
MGGTGLTGHLRLVKGFTKHLYLEGRLEHSL